ncbi:MAG: hypothetical protein WC624_01920 [Candidatus Margulisiibacteriota bacterium]
MVLNISTSLIRNLPASGNTNNDRSNDDDVPANRDRTEGGIFFRPENYQMLADLIRDMKEEEKGNYLAADCVAKAKDGQKIEPNMICRPTNIPLPPPKVEGIFPDYVQKKEQEVWVKIHGDFLPAKYFIGLIELSENGGNQIKNLEYKNEGNNILLKIKIDQNTREGKYSVKIFGKPDKKGIRTELARGNDVFTVGAAPLTPYPSPKWIDANNQPYDISIAGENMNKSIEVKVVAANDNNVVLYSTNVIKLTENKRIIEVSLKLDPDQLATKLIAQNEGLKKKYALNLIVNYPDGAKTILPFIAIDGRLPPAPPCPSLPSVPACQAPSVCMVPPQPLGRTIVTRELEADNTEHNITIVGPDLDKVAKVRIMVQKDGEDKEIYSVDAKDGKLSDQNPILTVPITIDPQKLKTLDLQGRPAKTHGRTNYDAIIVILDKNGSEIDRQKITLYQDSIPQTFAPWIEKGLAPQSEVGAVVNSEAGRVPIGLGFVPQVFGATDRAMVKVDELELNFQARGSLFLGEEYKEVPNGARLGGNVIIKPFKWLGIEAKGNYTWSGSGSTMNLPYFYRMKSQTGKFVGALHFEVPKIIKFKFNAEYTGIGYSDTNGVKTADDRWRGTAALLLDMTKFTDSVWAPSRISANGGFVFYGTRTADGQEDKLRGGGFMSHLRWDKGIFSECPIEPYFGIELEKSSSTRNWNPHLGVNFNIMDFLRNTLGERYKDILPPQNDY